MSIPEYLVEWAYLAGSLVLACSLAITLGHIARRAARRSLLVTSIGAGMLILAALSMTSYQGSLLAVMILGFACGRYMSLSIRTFHGLYLASLYSLLVVSILDLLWDSGIARFGLPAPGDLFDSQLAASAVVESLAGSILAAAVFGVTMLLAYMAVRSICNLSEHRVVLWALICASGVTYLLETQVQPGISHPLFIHHPLVTAGTGAGLAIGFVAGTDRLLPTFSAMHPSKPIMGTAVYFFAYHFVVSGVERTAGWVFTIPYGWLAVSSLAITLPFGVMIGLLWSNGEQAFQLASGYLPILLTSLASFVRDLEDALDAVSFRETAVKGVFSAMEDALEGRDGPPEAWQAVTADVAAMTGLVSALAAVKSALEALRVVRYREDEIPPEVDGYIRTGLMTLDQSRRQLQTAWGRVCDGKIIQVLPGFRTMIDIDDLDSRLAACEADGKSLLKEMKRL